ncbi:MAG: 4Fe-4S dicluster domain-containing protein [Candidatus Bathyarchaeia archaeon]
MEKVESDRTFSSDIFSLLVETSEREKRKRRENLLAPLGIKEFFVDGRITIDKRTCKGVECKLCIKVCPTNALYWKSSGEVGIVDELCIYCGACVLNCMVDDCIRIERRREDGTLEKFSTPRAFITLENSVNTKKRFERVKAIFPSATDYLRLYKPTLT